MYYNDVKLAKLEITICFSLSLNNSEHILTRKKQRISTCTKYQNIKH